MDEVNKLLLANFFREVYYLEWLANIIMVKMANGKWRMCVDFTDLNNACAKDSFPLPRINQLVDSMAGHKLLTFMTPSLDTTKYKWQKMIKRRLPSSLARASTIIGSCLSV